MVNAFGKHKLHSHHNKCHMVMPGLPFPNLVVGHTAFTFRIFKYPLYPVALSLHPTQTLQSCMRRSIGQRYFKIRILSNTLRNDQMETMSRIRLAIPHINFEATTPNFKPSTCGISKRHRPPMVFGKRTHNFTDFYTFLISLILHGRTSAFSRSLWKIGSWVLQKYMKIRMQIHNKRFAHFVKRKAKAGALTVPRISSNPCVVKIVFPSVAHNFHGKLGFGAKHTMLFRNTCPLATLRIHRPLFWQVQPGINRRRKSALHEGAEHRYLAVIDLAQPAQPLARDSDRTTTLFSKTTFIYQKASIVIITQKLISIMGNVINHLSLIPFGVGQELFKIARFGARYDFGHSIHVFTGTCLHEAGGVLASLFRHIMAIGLEMFCVCFHKGYKATPDAGKRQRVGGCIRFPPSFSRMFSSALTS